MKTIVIIANCQGIEIARYLQSSLQVSSQYKVIFIANYLDPHDEGKKREIYSAISIADVVISQNVLNIEWLRNDQLIQFIRADCDFIQLAFWRFDGYWPLELPRFRDSLWYLPIEAGPVSNFNEYINYPIPRIDIQARFDSQMDKFVQIDQGSDFSMAEFFLANHRDCNLFSDHWHPTSYFFFELTRRIMSRLGLEPDIELQPNDHINRDRYRPVFNCVAEELGLQFDPSILRFHQWLITREVFFEFSSYAATCLEQESMAELAALFDVWRQREGLQVEAVNLATQGIATQSSRSQWSFPDDPQRAVSCKASGSFAFHTELDPAPWWQIDLRDFREVSEIAIWNREADGRHLQLCALPLTVSTSIDAQNWREIATIDYPFGGAASGSPLRFGISQPVVARHVRLQVKRPTYLHLDHVEIFSRVMQRP